MDKKVMSKEEFENMTEIVGGHGGLCDIDGENCCSDCPDHSERYFKQYVQVEGEE